MTEPQTSITDEQRTAVRDCFADAEDGIRALSDSPDRLSSRELSLAMTNLEQSRMWVFAHLRVLAGGRP